MILVLNDSVEVQKDGIYLKCTKIFLTKFQDRNHKV